MALGAVVFGVDLTCLGRVFYCGFDVRCVGGSLRPICDAIHQTTAHTAISVNTFINLFTN